MENCSIDGCARKKKYIATGWCQTHYHRWWRTGDPNYVTPPKRVDVPSYRALHSRIMRERGKAVQYECRCGNQAEQWAYDGTDPQPLWASFKSRTVPYSLDTMKYLPLCRGCHLKLDRYEKG